MDCVPHRTGNGFGTPTPKYKEKTRTKMWLKTIDFPYFSAILAMFWQILVHIFCLLCGGWGSWQISDRSSKCDTHWMSRTSVPRVLTQLTRHDVHCATKARTSSSAATPYEPSNDGTTLPQALNASLPASAYVQARLCLTSVLTLWSAILASDLNVSSGLQPSAKIWKTGC